VEDVGAMIGADTLRYMSMEKFAQVLGEGVCYACFTGKYLHDIDVAWAERGVMSGRAAVARP
jgi:amidophosphoribosyltransferase